MKHSIYALAVEETTRQAQLAALEDEVSRLNKVVEAKDARAYAIQRHLVETFKQAQRLSYALLHGAERKERVSVNARVECYATAVRVVEDFLFVF